MGQLAGNFMVRQMTDNVLSAVTGGSTDYGSFKQLGIETTSNGALTFDKDAFAKAYAADPTKAQAAITSGLGKALNDLTTKATTNITATIQSGTDAIRDLNNQISDWDVRLADRQAALQTQYTNLEVALGKLKDQSSWLSGQISSLSTSSSSSSG